MATRLFGTRFNMAPGTRPTAWQTLGHNRVQKLPAGTSILDAFQQADLDYEIIKAPLTALLPNGTTVYKQNEVGLFRAPTRLDVLYRDLNAVVDSKFGVIQNETLARSLQPIADKWPLEAVGSFGDGANTFLTFKTGGFSIGRDHIDQHLLVMDGKTGGSALHFALIAVNLWCTNQMYAALRNADGSGLHVAFPHHQNVEADLHLYASIFNEIAHGQQLQQQAFQILAQTSVTRAQAKEIISAAFPLIPPTKKQRLLENVLAQEGFLKAEPKAILDMERANLEIKNERAKLIQVAALSRLDAFNDEQNPDVADTAYVVYNVVAEVSDNRAGTNEKTAAIAVLSGERRDERNRAFAKAWEFAGAPSLN